ncbi:MFS transporter [Xylanimonas oleitrophica]|uniref:MFS transporter n=1 Tax=Xylanimonas oleitrophica TaxID=2607479 RepID=A0A2W5WJZ5_9MICO|nr:oligopeptide:H+ symporter [Xylanimonas oleitrophica]PZR51577.1 MFS transporter [Xylanimonas oleitrophica]
MSTSDLSSRPHPAAAVSGDRRFFGHPLGLMTLSVTELWERFSYYGMRAILVYYITDTIAAGGLGIDQALGQAVVSIYGTAVYLLSVVGGWFADRLIGAYRATFLGGVIIAAGHVSLSVPGAGFSWLGICLVALGTGFLKPNVSSMVGEFYERDDPRRQSAFSIFYMGINLGSFFSPLVVGEVRDRFGYHAGFVVAAVGMAFALAFFVGGRRLLGGAGDAVPNPITPQERPAVVRMVLGVLAGVAALFVVVGLVGGFGMTTVIDGLSYLAFVVPIVFFVVMYRSPKVSDPERSRLLAYVPLFVAAMLFFMIFEQAATTLATYARDSTELSFLWWDQINPEAFQSVNPLCIILLAPVFAWVWLKTKDRPATPYKFAIGLALAAGSFLFLAAASALAGGEATPAWVLGLVYLIQTLGELCLSPVGLAATTLLAPRAFRGQAMALWFLAPAAGQAITAQLVQVTDGMAPTPFFGGIGAVALVFALAVAALGPWVVRRMRAADAVEGVRTSGD